MFPAVNNSACVCFSACESRDVLTVLCQGERSDQHSFCVAHRYPLKGKYQFSQPGHYF